jgi:hypothetical protein
MKLVVRTGPNTVGLNYMWMPTWVGMNTALLLEIEAHLKPVLVGKALTEESLQLAHDSVLNFLVERFSEIHGLLDYIDGIKFVEEHGEAKEGPQENEEGRPAAHPS